MRLGIGLALTDPRPAGGAPSTLLTGLAGHWPLTEASGTRADSLGLNDLAQNGTVGSAAGLLGDAAVFDGSDSNYLSAAGVTGGAAGTFSCWVRIGTDVSYGMATSCGSGEGELRYADVRMPEFTSAGVSAAAGSAVALATWHLIVGWWDNTNVYLEVNNSGSIASAAVRAPIISGLQVGRRYGGGYALNGRVQYLSYWARALTAPERTELYNGGTPVPYPF